VKPLLAVTALIASFSVQANNATAVFESVSNSIVVVYGKNTQGKTVSLGSGVVLSTGEIVTNCHVIEESISLAVKHGTREFPATLKYSDYDSDICSLTVPGLSAPAVTLGSSKSLKVGQKVFAVGAPRGLELTLSEGIVSSLREVKGGRYLQISAPISPGSSGGGLFDSSGHLIGLPTFYISEGQQLNFAVPVEWVKVLPQRHSAGKNSKDSIGLSWLMKAIVFEGKKDWLGLLRNAQEWTTKHPDHAIAWFSLGVAHSEVKEYIDAVKAYQQALRIYQDYVDAWNNLGLVYFDSNQYAKAIDAYQQALRIDPDNANAWFNLGTVYTASNQYAKAIEAYQQALRINPEDANAWSKLGLVYAYSNQGTKAIEAYQQALRINPEDAEAWYNLGVIYKITGQISRATDVYRRLKNLDPASADKFFINIVLP